MIFSNQKGFCFICGIEFIWNVNTPYINSHVCSKVCFDELKLREIKSTLGK